MKKRCLLLSLVPPVLFFGMVFSSNADAVEVDTQFVNFVNEQLPEYDNSNSQFTDNAFDDYLTFAEAGDLNVTFVSEGAGFRNQLGWFIYDNAYTSDVRLEDLTYGTLFSDYSNDVVSLGDTASVTFAAGDNVGFWLAANGYNNNNSGPIYYSVDSMNKDGNHTAQFMVEDTVVWAFEDLPIASGDRDFNDAVFVVTATPPNAFGSTNIATAPVPMLSGGLFGLLGTLGVMVLSTRRRKQ